MAKKLKKKIVLLGNFAVGKTSLIRRFVYDQFEDSYISTIGLKVSKKDLSIKKNGEDIKFTLMVWDVMGRPGYRVYHEEAFAGADGAILVADITRRETLDDLERYWLPVLLKTVNNAPLVFLKNKIDLKADAEFGMEDLKAVALRYNEGIAKTLPDDLSSHYSTSAKTGKNVDEAFQSIAHLIFSHELLEDSIKELINLVTYESVIGDMSYENVDKSTLAGVIDALILDFCKNFDDLKKAEEALRLEFVRAGVDVRRPTKDSLLKLIDYLAWAEAEFKNEKLVREDHIKRSKLINDVKEDKIKEGKETPLSLREKFRLRKS